MSRLRPAERLPAAAVALLTVLCLLAGFAPAAPAAGTLGIATPEIVPKPVGGPRVILAFLGNPETPANGQEPQPGDPDFDPPTVLSTLNSEPTLALGLSSATQGGYQQVQALLDISQGTRTSTAAYTPHRAPDLTFYPYDHGTKALFQGFLDAKDRAASAPAEIYPGLLGQSIPGGVAYAGVRGRSNVEAIAGVNEAGRIGRVSLGHSDDVARRALELSLGYELVVAGLPAAQTGAHQLDLLLRGRPAGTLVIAMQTPPAQGAPVLLPTGVAGLGKVGALTSTTTHLPGIVAGIDVLPTVLGKLSIAVPDSVKGQPMRVEGKRDQAALLALSQRLRVVGPQRFPTLEAVLAAWLGVILLLALFADRRGYRAALRVGGLATLWILPMLLVTAQLAPSKGTEILIVVVGTMVLGALTDRFVAWPRAPIVPCLVTIVAYSVDLAFGSPLIIRSLLGSNPLFGSRFYGIGNELESSLPVIALVGVAAFLDRRERGRGMVAWFAGVMLFLGLVVGSGRLGADVGGVITIGAGGAAAVVFSLPGGVTKRAVVVAILVPILALGGLAVLDTATGGDGHFTRTVLHANGESALQDIVQRRFELAFNVLKRGGMPFATAISILAAAFAIRYWKRVYAPLEGRAAWKAAFAGALASSIAGALANDSGPELLVIGVVCLAFVTAYVRGDPRLAVAPEAPAAPGAPGAEAQFQFPAAER